MTYSGTLIRDLVRSTEQVVVRHSNDTLCAHCYFPLGSHSNFGRYCPNPSDFGPLHASTQFSPLTCEHVATIYLDAIGESIYQEECSEPLVMIDLASDQGRCLKHGSR